MNELVIALPKLHTSQRQANKAAARFALFNCGRRWGKDILMERRRVSAMLHTPAPYGWFAPSYRMMTENYRSLENRLATVTKRATASEHRIELINGSVIEFWSLDNFNAARGRKYAGVTVNEAASSPNLIDAWNYVIRPTLADLKGAADFGSTPKGLNGFYTLWANAEGDKDWSRYHATTYDNPHIPPDEIDAMRATMPERVFRQEIMAEFVEDGSFFQHVDDVCTVEIPANPEDHKGHRFFAGLDWALMEDYTRLTVICADCAMAVDWWGSNRMDYAMQIGHVKNVLARWPSCVLLPERNSMGAPNIENLVYGGVRVGRGHDGGYGFMTMASSKPDLIMRLALAIENKSVRLPKEYADELRAYEVEVTTTNPKFSAPSGQHDDRVISAALAWWASTNTGHVGIDFA